MWKTIQDSLLFLQPKVETKDLDYQNMPKAVAIFQLMGFDFVCVRERDSTYYTEHDLRTITDMDLFLEVSTMKYDNNEDNPLCLLKLDQDTLQLLQVRAEVHQAV